MPFNVNERERAVAAGKKGGAKTLKRYGRSSFVAKGIKGGNAVKEKFGREYFSRIGSITKKRKNIQEDND